MSRLEDKANIQKVVKVLRNPGAEPSVPSSDYKTDGTWVNTDIYKGQIAINEVDDRIWYRHNSGIRELISNKYMRGFDRLEPDSMGDFTFDLTGRTFSIYPKSGEDSFYFYTRGRKNIKTTTQSVVWPDITNTYYFYFDTGATLQYIVEEDFSESEFKQVALCGLIYWNASSQKAIIQASDERHGIIMDASTHFETHLAFGAKYMRGGHLIGMADASDTYTNITLGIYADEDITHMTPNSTAHTFMYRNGDVNEWYETEANNEVGYMSGGSNAYWNEEVSPGVWELTESTNLTDYIIYFFLWTNDSNNPIKKLIGTQTYSSRENAREGLLNELRAIELNGLSTPEAIFTYAYIVRKNGDIEDDGNGNPYVDLRTSRNFNLNT